MAKLGIMIEAQDGLSWERWRRLCHDVEERGFDSLRRSDHFFSVMGVEGRQSLETWVSLALAAEWTQKIEFGPMVSSMTFRAPALLARMAAAVDELSGGRLILGVGAGWYEEEHRRFDIPFPPVKERMDGLELGIEIMKKTWETSLPAPARNPMPILIGGDGERRTLPLAARVAAEWNLPEGDADLYKHKAAVLARCCREIDRDPTSIRHSMMTGYLIGRNASELEERARGMQEVIPRFQGMTPAEVLKAAEDWVVGTPEQIVERLRALAALGVDLFMFQHFLLDDTDALDLLAREVIPAIA